MNLKTVAVWTAIVAAILGGTYLLVRAERQTTGDRTAAVQRDLLTLRPGDHVRGQTQDPAVVIVEYSDFQCPACNVSRKVTDGIEHTAEGKVAFVYRHFPLVGIHPNARAAAYAAEAAALQGKFWEMHDMLFAQQGEWSATKDPSGMFATYAAAIGLDVARWSADYASDTVRERVAVDANDADTLRLQGTPTVFVNGLETDLPRTAEAFAAQVAAAVR